MNAVTEQQIYSELNDIFCEILDDDSIQIAAETTAAEIPEWDSFSHINLVVAIELKFNVKFGSYDVERLENVGDMVSLLLAKLNG